MSHTDEDPHTSLLDGRYRLGERLGRGGMADVFRAEDVVLGREVAVKLIRPGVDGVATPERARGEVSALAALNHPSLVTLLDARLEGTDQEYLVMELVEGPTLAERIREGALPGDEVSRIAGEIAEALHVVHGAGIVHRDIKPSNVLLGPAPVPGRRYHAKLADFGIAYLVDSTRMTSPGLLIGTAAYLAPEQVNGSDPAPAADVYALGLVLLEALTGTPAFPHAGGVASAIARLNAPPEIPAALGAEWVGLIERMTRIDPAERPTALEVAVEASRWTTGMHPAPLVAAAAVPGTSDPTEVLDIDESATKVFAPPPLPPVAAAAAAAAVGVAGTAAGAASGVAATASPDDPGTTSAPDASARPGRRRGVLIGAAAAAAVALIGGGVWATSLAASPTPSTTEPAVTEPEVTSTVPAPSAPAPSATPAVVGTVDDDGDADNDADKAAKDAEKAAKDAAKEAEEAQKRAEEDARKQAEEAQRQAEEQAEQQQEDQSGDDGDDDVGPAPAPEPSAPAAPSPAPSGAP